MYKFTIAAAAAVMSATSSTSYPLGGTQTELDRLLAQAAIYEPETNWLLDQIGVGSGGRRSRRAIHCLRKK